MAWSYRQDCSDETYHEPGVCLVEGEKLPDTPANAEHAKDMMDPKRVEKRQKDEEEAQKKAPSPAQKAAADAKQKQENEDRSRIRSEEAQKIRDEEHEKDMEKMRKEEAANAKKDYEAQKKDDKGTGSEPHTAASGEGSKSSLQSHANKK